MNLDSDTDVLTWCFFPKVWDFVLLKDDTRLISGSSDAELRVFSLRFKDPEEMAGMGYYTYMYCTDVGLLYNCSKIGNCSLNRICQYCQDLCIHGKYHNCLVLVMKL